MFQTLTLFESVTILTYKLLYIVCDRFTPIAPPAFSLVRHVDELDFMYPFFGAAGGEKSEGAPIQN